MLNFFRKRTKAIVWMVVVAFIAWGGYAVSLQFEEGGRAPGRIFGKEVSFREHLRASRAVQIFNPDPPGADPPSAEVLEARAWEFLILSYEARRRKIDVSDEEVRQEIRRLLTAREGTPSLTQEGYQNWVRAVFREEPAEFESQLREHLRIRRLLDQARKELPENSEKALRDWLVRLYRRARPEVYRPAN